MSNQYKVGDLVLVEAEITRIYSYGFDFKIKGDESGYSYFDTIYSHTPTDIDGNVLRPGDECEFWYYASEGIDHGEFMAIDFTTAINPYYVSNIAFKYKNCRKITKPKTIEIDGKTYNADEVRERLKELKPVKGDRND